MKTRIAIASACLLAGVMAPSADAYTTFGEWAGNSTQCRAATVSFPVGAWRTSLTAVDAAFDRNPSEAFINQTWNDGSVGIGNGQNEIWFSADSAHSPAVCYTTTLFGIIVEYDMVFWNGIPYTTSMSKLSIYPYKGASRPFQTTALHERGHAAGLGHEADEYNIMGQDWTHIHCNGSTCTGYMGEDAADGLVALYGRWSGGTIQDVAATLFRRTGSSGAYSSHGPCRMFNSAGAVLASVNFEGQRRYTVTSGQVVRVQFTFENCGETTQSPRCGFYLSTNSTISTGDTFITSVTPTLGRGDVSTFTYTITLPAIPAATTRYLGVIVDDNSLITENDNNNAAYHIIRRN